MEITEWAKYRMEGAINAWIRCRCSRFGDTSARPRTAETGFKALICPSRLSWICRKGIRARRYGTSNDSRTTYVAKKTDKEPYGAGTPRACTLFVCLLESSLDLCTSLLEVAGCRTAVRMCGPPESELTPCTCGKQTAALSKYRRGSECAGRGPAEKSPVVGQEYRRFQVVTAMSGDDAVRTSFNDGDVARDTALVFAIGGASSPNGCDFEARRGPLADKAGSYTRVRDSPTRND